jgi:hypothetical protein
VGLVGLEEGVGGACVQDGVGSVRGGREGVGGAGECGGLVVWGRDGEARGEGGVPDGGEGTLGGGDGVFEGDVGVREVGVEGVVGVVEEC